MSTSTPEPSGVVDVSKRKSTAPTRRSPRSPASESDAAPTETTSSSSKETRKDGLDPSLPADAPPPLPNEAPPGQVEDGDDDDDDDGWDPVWDESAQAFYFYNRFTKVSQWENPRIPTVTEPAPPGVGHHDRIATAPGTESPPPLERPAGGYDPAIHGDYDPNADYAKVYEEATGEDSSGLQFPGTVESSDAYAATGSFNRFTGKWQVTTLNPDNFNDENKSRRQMSAYFDVDAAANSHEGKSLKAERSGKKLSKKELKAFKDKRRERKEEKRKAWLRD